MGCGSSTVEGESKAVIVGDDKRKCRDVLCTALFGAWWVGMVLVLVQGIQYGDPWKLVCGTDFEGNVCGSSDGKCVSGSGASLEEGTCGKYITYPRMDQDLFLLATSDTYDHLNPEDVLNFPYYGVCRESCPIAGEWVCNQHKVMELNTKNGVHPDFSTDSDLLSDASIAELKACKREKDSKSFFQPLSASCAALLEGCWKMYVVEDDLFFRCIPRTEDNSTCSESPYLDFMREQNPDSKDYEIGTMTLRGETVSRPALARYHCGKCLDPILDENGHPTDPKKFYDGTGCKAVEIRGVGIKSEATVNPVFEELNSWTAELRQYMADVQQTWWQIIVSGVVGATLIGCVWLVLLYLFAPVFVYTAVWGFFFASCGLTLALMLAGGVITTQHLSDAATSVNGLTGDATVNAEDASAAVTTIQKANVFGDQEGEAQAVYEVLAWVSAVFTVIVLLMIVSMWSSIRIATQIIREGTLCIRAVPSLLVFPITTVSFTVALFVYWAYVAMLISSSSQLQNLEVNSTLSPLDSAVSGLSRRLSGAPNWHAARALNVNGTGNTTFAPTSAPSESNAAVLGEIGGVAVQQLAQMDLQQQLWLYHFFGFLWSNQLIQAIGCTTIAGATAIWYYAHPTEKAANLPRAPVLKAYLRCFRYHFGSLAFGSLIIAIIQFIRFLLAYLDKQTKGLQDKNPVVRIFMKIVQCCLWCFEKIVKWISKNAYIVVAIHGLGFCSSTKKAVSIILSNITRIGTAALVSTLVIILGRLIIIIGSAALCWVLVTATTTGEYANDYDLSSDIVPSVVAALVAWFVSGCFMEVYGVAIQTILICFCEDEQYNDGSAQKPYYMSKGLLSIVGKKNAKAKVSSASDESDE